MISCNNMESHGLLSGKQGIIFGAIDHRSIAWTVAQHCVAEGASIILTNTDTAITIGEVNELAASLNTPLIPCDATDIDSIQNLLQESTKLLGGKIDFILHSIALSQNLRRHKTYENLNYNYLQQTIDISAISLHKILQTALTLDTLSNGASIVALTYIASSRYLNGYNDMADAKALLESITRNFGGIYGEKNNVRINTISQSPLPTRAGAAFDEMDHFRQISDKMAPLGNAAADDCADLCVMLFSDYTRKITMQNIYNDGGFSATALSETFKNHYRDKI